MDERPVGRLMTVEEAIQFYERCKKAEEVMGELSMEERMLILSSFGEALTQEELQEKIAGKKVLIVKNAEELSDGI